MFWRSKGTVLGTYKKSRRPFILTPDDYDIGGTIIDKSLIFSYSKSQLSQFRYLMDIRLDDDSKHRIRGSYCTHHDLRFSRNQCGILLEFESIEVSRFFFINKTYIIDHRNTCITSKEILQTVVSGNVFNSTYTLGGGCTRVKES